MICQARLYLANKRREKLQRFHDDITNLLVAAEGDDLLEIVKRIISQRDSAISALRGIQETAEKEIFTGEGPQVSSCIFQIQANAQAALEIKK